MTIKVKICGINCLEDALNASELGADALGFVFVKDTPRYIKPHEASQIICQLPPFLSKVGLFVNSTQDEIEEVISICNLDFIQFHGEEDVSFCEQFNLPYIKAIAVKSDLNLVEYSRAYKSASALLFDTFSKNASGGTGHTFDWNLIPPNLPKPIIIAGGLTGSNLGELFRKIIPYAVDVSSGVEGHKGKKDYTMMKDFILGVRNASL